MCIISYAPKGTLKGGEKVEDFIKSGSYCNGQGSGYMFKRNGEDKVNIRKGFFDVDILIKSLNADELGIDDELVVHHRIGTSGKINDENTHPFVISTKHEECIMLKGAVKKPVLVHNGIFRSIDYYENLDPDYSDTYAFTRFIMADKNILSLLDRDKKLYKTVMNGIIGSSKLVILYPDKETEMLGDFIEDEGYFHSNRGYCTYTYDSGGSSFGNTYAHNWNHRGFVRSNEGSNTATPRVLGPVAGVGLNSQRKEENNDYTDHKYMLMKTDSTFIRINSKNFNHFWYFNKEKWDAYKKEGRNMPRYAVIETYDDNVELNSISFRNTDGKPGYYFETISADQLRDKYYYMPKKEYYHTYVNYLHLITAHGTTGKQTIKKLEKLLNNKTVLLKRNDEKVYYKRLDKEFTKLSLTTFKNYLQTKRTTDLEKSKERRMSAVL